MPLCFELRRSVRPFVAAAVLLFLFVALHAVQAQPVPAPRATAAHNAKPRHAQSRPRAAAEKPSPKPSPKATQTPVPAPPARSSLPRWAGYVLAVVVTLLVAVPVAVVAARRGDAAPTRTGAVILAALPLLAALGLVAIPFAPDVQSGAWVPIEVLAVAFLVTGAFLGFLYGLPVVDVEAVKAAGTTAGTFLRPGTKLDSVIDSILPALTGGVLAFAHPQASRFNAVFLDLAHLPKTSASQLLGMGILAYFTPLGFILSYTLTSTVGALAFKVAQETLVEQSAIVKTYPQFPDVPLEPNDDQIAAAKTIVARPYASLHTAAEKATWARAQTILRNYLEAIKAFQDAIVLDPRSPTLVIDYATAIYNEPSIDDIPLVLGLIERAETLCGPQAPELLRRRILTLRAAALLYEDGRYQDVIVLVNDWIASGLRLTRLARFYRACAFGQLYESCVADPAPAAPPYVAIAAADTQAVKAIVRNDIALTLASTDDKGVANVKVVMEPSRDRVFAQDDDLQTLTADDPQLRAAVGIANPPPLPAPPRPPRPARLPDPTATDPGTLAQWIAVHCPT